jgi:hypothetical protein
LRCAIEPLLIFFRGLKLEGKENLATRLSNPTANKNLPSLVQPRQTINNSKTTIIRNQFIFIETILRFIMAGAEKAQESAVGSPAPKQKSRATIDTLR